MKDVINFIDGDYGTVREDSRFSSNQIRTRQSSFQSIVEKWKNFRLSLLNKKLERVKNELVSDTYKTDSSSKLSDKTKDKIMSKTTTIARLEEKIMILSKENVPSHYVRNRAIKLRDKMMKNLTYHSGNLYSVKEDHYDEIFEDSSAENQTPDYVTPPMFEEAAALSTTSDIDVEKVATDNESILADEVNRAMLGDSIKTAEEVPSTITREEISSVVEEKFKKMDENNAPLVSPEVVAETVNGTFSGVPPIEAEEEPILPREVTQEEVESVVVPSSDDDSVIDYSSIQEVVDEAIQKIKVPNNESSAAKIDQFDSEGQPKPRYDYTPMTDEEIAEARKNIEYDKYEKIYEDEWKQKQMASDEIPKKFVPEIVKPSTSFFNPLTQIEDIDLPSVQVTSYTGSADDEVVRDEIVVVPERENITVPEYVSDYSDSDELEEFTFENTSRDVSENSETPIDLHFDYSEATERDIAQASSVETSLEGLEALKARALRLQEEQRQSKMDLDAVYEEQTDVAREAYETKNQKLATKQEFGERESKLMDYCAALEEDIKINQSSARIARNDIECNKRFIEMQKAEIDDYRSRINEIDSIISPEAKNVRRR